MLPDRERALAAEWFHTGDLTEEDQRVLSEAKEKSGRSRFLRGQCFRNAMILALSDERVSYVEGVSLGGSGRPIHHAWNLIGGKVVDVTWKAVGRGYLGRVYTTAAVRSHWISLGTGLVAVQMLTNDEVRDLLMRAEGPEGQHAA